jgi:hypothetical protein
MMKHAILILVAALLLVPGLTLAQTEKKQATADPVQAWVETLTKRIADGNPTVKASVHQALVSVGEPALASLKKIAEGEDPGRAVEAKRVIQMIERRGQRGDRGQDRRGRDPLEDLGLEGEAKEKASKATEDYNRKRTELFERMRSGEMDRSEIRDAMEALREDYNDEMKNILDEEQYKKFQENSQRRRWGGRGGRGGRRGGSDG